MSVRVYRSANKANAEAQALYHRISKAQLAVVKETDELAEKHDTSQMARQAQELAKRQEFAAANAQAARAKEAATLFKAMTVSLITVSGFINKVAGRLREREAGQLGGLEEMRLREEAGRQRPQPRSETQAPVLGRHLPSHRPESTRDNLADPARQANPPSEAPVAKTPGQASIAGDGLDRNVGRVPATSVTQPALRPDTAPAAARITPSFLAERDRLRRSLGDAAAEERRWWQEVVQGERMVTTRGLFGLVTSTAPAGSWVERTVNRFCYDKAAAGLERADAAWERFIETHAAEEAALKAAPSLRFPGLERPASDPTCPGSVLAPPAPSQARTITIAPGPLPPHVAGNAPPAGARAATIAVGPGVGSTPALPPPQPAAIGLGSDPGSERRAGGNANPPSPMTDPIRRWQTREGGAPLAGNRSERLATLTRMAANQTLTEADLRSNADLFDYATLQEVSGLLRADLGASFCGEGTPLNLAGERLARMTVDAGGSPGIAYMIERATQLKRTAQALLTAVERYRLSGRAEDRAAVSMARQHYEDALLGADSPLNPDRQTHWWRLLLVEARMAAGEGHVAALSGSLNQAFAAWEEFNKLHAEADAEQSVWEETKKLEAAWHLTMQLYGKLPSEPVKAPVKR